MLQICENIRLARLSKSVTQEEMASKMKVSRSTYKNWEEKTVPDIAIIKALATALEVPPISLLSGVIDPNPADLIQANEIQKKRDIEDIKVSLNTLTSAIGRLAGLDKEEIFSLPVAGEDNKEDSVFEDQRKKKKDNLNKRGN